MACQLASSSSIPSMSSDDDDDDVFGPWQFSDGSQRAAEESEGAGKKEDEES